MNRDCELYLALGDSISIDSYPQHDYEERRGRRKSGLGAVSLFHRNHDDVFPEFKGHDLTHLVEGIRKVDLTSDGAVTQTVLRDLERVEHSHQKTLATLTIGGNDLLSAVGIRGTATSASPVKGIASRLRQIVETLLERRPESFVIVGTVYDPTDDTFILSGRDLRAEAPWLREYNDEVRALVKADRRLRLADIHAHFLGHGELAEDSWYWKPSPIEPGYVGASEIRRLWLEAMG